jgi:single-strand DNA-binding protein
MAGFNKVILMGNLTRDPELKMLPSNTAVCDFGMAVNRSWTGADGVKKEEVTFVDCSCFGKIAEVLAQYKKKGDALMVDGRLKLDQWDAQDGSKRSKLTVVVENFQFIGGKREEEGGYQGEPVAPARTQQAPQRQPQRQQPMQRPLAANGTAPRKSPAAAMFDEQMETSAPIKDDDIPF